MRSLVYILLPVLMLNTALAAQLPPEPQNYMNLSSGPRMLVLPREEQHETLTGKAPDGEGEPFRILNGAEVLWEGRAGESFEVKTRTKHVYLLSSRADNNAWQELTWKGETAGTGCDVGIHTDALPTDKSDAGPGLRRLLSQTAQGGKQNCISIPKGEYHFYPAGALEMSYYISNHDQQDIQPVGIPIVGQSELTIEGHGSTFVFHGKMQPILVMDSKKVKLKDITIRLDNPYYNEGKIVEIKGGTTTLEYAPQFCWEVKNGCYYLTGDGKPKVPSAVLAFHPSGQMVPTGKGGDIPWRPACKQISENQVQFYTDASGHGLSVGDILVHRHYGRPHPAMVLYRAQEIELNNIVFRDSQGMALVAQRSRDICIQGGGCICAPERVYTVSADATHFSNCAGTITVQDALYEGMMDDAINVHSTCLSIEKVVNERELIARYMHPQAVGFEVFLPGERIQFIRGKTLENHPDIGKVATVEKWDETHLRITLEAPLPADIGEGDAIENADWYPAVNFIGCTVRHNRARGSLFTTPKPVLVKGCKFVASHGSAILLAGDAQGWYESGSCQDVRIINNLFDHNLTARYQFTEGIISIYPEVKEPNRQQTRYHRNILIEGNTFLTHRVPLLYAISADNIIFRNNTVITDDKYPGMHGGVPYILQHCGKVQLQKI